jgi:hypothetical protein
VVVSQPQAASKQQQKGLRIGSHVTLPPFPHPTHHTSMTALDPSLPPARAARCWAKSQAHTRPFLWTHPLVPPSPPTPPASMQLHWYFPAHLQIVKSHEQQSAVQLMIPVPGEVRSSLRDKSDRGRVWKGQGRDASALYTKAKL